MDIVREIRLSDADRLALQRSFDIVNQLADCLGKDANNVFRDMEFACYNSMDHSYNVPDTLEMEIFD